jgi:hypothetical protein
MFNPPTSPLARPRNNEMAIPIPTNPMVYGTLVLDENNAAAKIMAKKMRIRYSEVVSMSLLLPPPPLLLETEIMLSKTIILITQGFQFYTNDGNNSISVKISINHTNSIVTCINFFLSSYCKLFWDNNV